MVGGAPPTRGDDGMKHQQGRDGIGIVRHRRCKYCVQNGRSLEKASNCPGRGVGKCVLEEKVVYGISLQCVTCNSITKCRCPIPNRGARYTCLWE